MDWANERYIRLYTRDSGDWLMWPWQTRALFVFILRKVDRSGLLHLGRGGLYALAAIVGMPSPDVTEWIEPLIDDGCVQIRDGVLCVPNYIAAQETRQTDRARQKASREMARSKAMNPQERSTDRPNACPVSLDELGHDLSPAVTKRHSEPSLAVPSLAERESAPPRESVARLKSVPPPAPDPERPPPPESVEPEEPAEPESGFDLAKRVFGQEWQAKYRRPYPFDWADAGPKSEKRVLQAFGNAARDRGGARAEEFARHWVKAFLRSHGDKNWLDEHAHPARTLMRDLASYGEPAGAKQRPPARASPPEAPPVSVADQASRAALLAGNLGKIGMGGGR